MNYPDLKHGSMDGVSCPCCAQLVKTYKRQIYNRMAAELFKLYHKRTKKDWVHISEISISGVSGGGDFAKLKYWGLVEERPCDPGDRDTRTSGYWRITEKGCRFLQGEVHIPKYVFIYNGQVQGFDPDCQVSVFDCLGDKFNYQELMNGGL